MWRRLLISSAPLALIILIPVLLRDRNVEDNIDADQLVIVSPHNEAIRFEFEQAFRRYYQVRHGRDVDIDWRTPGGTSEIVRYIKSEYTAAFRHSWSTEHGGEWTSAVRRAFLNRKLRQGDASEEEWRVRQAFLASDVGIGIDLFFGGGQYDFGRLAGEGVLVSCGVRERHPDWFNGDDPLIRQKMSGEVWYDPEDRYYGACLSSFGLCYNFDRLAELGVDGEATPFPSGWEDLGDVLYRGHIGVADPSKSGSITKCFEMLIQQKMAATIAVAAGNRPHEAALAEGWREAMLLVRKIGGNARYFTFSASKVPVDVAQGDVVAGMCIDFYGRSQAEWERKHGGREIMRYAAPLGGSSVSADPIGLLRGAPHRECAQEFIDFVLSREGQQLWNYRVGVDGGPVQYALRRLPIRHDMYSPSDRASMSDPDAWPYQLAAEFTYHPEWTGRLFGLIRVLIRVMIIDCHMELQEAWAAICAAGGPGQCAEAMVALRMLPFTYAEAGDQSRALRDAATRVAVTREWAAFFRARYREARDLARRG